MAALFGFLDPGTQAWMLLDEVRTRAYAEAIARTVKPGDVVVDVGSGSGILALLAARAGARRVYAIEMTAMASLIDEHARQNGLEEVVRVVRARAEELSGAVIDEPPTVVVSETLGHFAPDEHVHRLMRAVRTVCAPEVTWIPRTYRMRFALARIDALDRELARLEGGLDVRLGALARRLRSRPTVAKVGPDELLGPERASAPIPVHAPQPSSYREPLVVERDGEANAIVASFEAELTDGVRLSTGVDAPATCWRQTVFPLDAPLPVRAGDRVEAEVRPRLVTDRGTWVWRVSRGEEARGGDAMEALVGGSAAEIAQELGLRLHRSPPVRLGRKLRAWRAILGAELEGATVETLAAHLRAQRPDDFADDEDARQEVMALLRAADAA
ncbi:MAG TPA: 50S ribosomal protein L11 methyltransferase [Sandaracinaceae bacterium LLY-WYZ-13_1]|nr:50S ribosomal protein L11 methyltransferase [Sandaracinaceae bacterium LLY-WYZ-13_1]